MWFCLLMKTVPYKTVVWKQHEASWTTGVGKVVACVWVALCITTMVDEGNEDAEEGCTTEKEGRKKSPMMNCLQQKLYGMEHGICSVRFSFYSTVLITTQNTTITKFSASKNSLVFSNCLCIEKIPIEFRFHEDSWKHNYRVEWRSEFEAHLLNICSLALMSIP